MVSSMKVKEMEIVKLKEDNNKLLTKTFRQKEADDQTPPSSLKVCIYICTIVIQFMYYSYICIQYAIATIVIQYMYYSKPIKQLNMCNM